MSSPATSNLLFATETLRLGRFEARLDHSRFADAGQVLRHVFVFPRTSVWIEHEHRRPFIADPTTVTLYNRGLPYRRRPISPEGDRCDWFAIAPGPLLELLKTHDASVADREEQPFAMTHIRTDPAAFALQRAVVNHVQSGERIQHVWAEESMFWVLNRLFAPRDRPLQAESPERRPGTARAIVEDVRVLVLARPEHSWTLEELGRASGRSAFQLCRAFQRVTGRPLHRWIVALRLGLSLERVAESSGDLAAIAVDLGFASHSHFSTAFRIAFGLTPREFRRAACAGSLPSAKWPRGSRRVTP